MRQVNINARVARFGIIFATTVWLLLIFTNNALGGMRFAQAVPPVCPPGHRLAVPGYNHSCLPDPNLFTIPFVFGTVVLPDEAMPSISQVYPVTSPGDPQLPPGAFPNWSVAFLPGGDLSVYNGITYGQLAANAGFNPQTITLAGYPAFAQSVPGQAFGEFLNEAYTANPFGSRTVDSVPGIKEALVAQMGVENYEASGVGRVPLRQVSDYARSGGGSMGSAVPQVAMQALQTALQLPPVRAFLQNSLSALGLADVALPAFSWLANLNNLALFNLPGIPLSVLKTLSEIFVPVWGRLVNVQRTDRGYTGRVPMLNSFGGFSCGPDAAGLELVGGDLAEDKATKMDFLLFDVIRIGIGGKNYCIDKDARGILAAVQAGRGMQVSKAWTVSTSMMDMTFQFAASASLSEMSLEGRMKICFTKKPWKDILGCSPSGAFPLAISLPTAQLAGWGVIIVPLRDLLASIIPFFGETVVTPQMLIETLAYVMQFAGANEVAAVLQGVPQMLQYFGQAQQFLQEAQSRGQIIGVPAYTPSDSGNRIGQGVMPWWGWEKRSLPLYNARFAFPSLCHRETQSPCGLGGIGVRVKGFDAPQTRT